MIDFYFILDLKYIQITITIKPKFTEPNFITLLKNCYTLLLGCDAM
jgi:hypothetical protein